MNQYAGTLIVCVCLGAVAAIGAGCDNASDSTGGAGSGSSGAPATSAGAGNTTAGTSSGTAGSVAAAGTTSTAGSTGSGTHVPLPSDDTGFVQVATLGIQGAWYAYGDGIGSDGMAASSNCEM